jgi:hypothetical protein
MFVCIVQVTTKPTHRYSTPFFVHPSHDTIVSVQRPASLHNQAAPQDPTAGSQIEWVMPSCMTGTAVLLEHECPELLGSDCRRWSACRRAGTRVRPRSRPSWPWTTSSHAVSHFSVVYPINEPGSCKKMSAVMNMLPALTLHMHMLE